MKNKNEAKNHLLLEILIKFLTNILTFQRIQKKQ
jgi:hypothetical protein